MSVTPAAVFFEYVKAGAKPATDLCVESDSGEHGCWLPSTTNSGRRCCILAMREWSERGSQPTATSGDA